MKTLFGGEGCPAQINKEVNTMKSKNAEDKRIQDRQMKKLEEDMLEDVTGGGAGFRPKQCPECGATILLTEGTCRHCGWPHLG